MSIQGKRWAESEVDINDPIEIFYKSLLPNISHCVVSLFMNWLLNLHLRICPFK